MNIIDTKVYRIEINANEFYTIRMCLDYAYHRLTKHNESGLHSKVNSGLVDKMRKAMEEKI